MIKGSSKKKAAAKKVTSLMCDGCFGIYAAGVCIKAPKNKYNFKVVCQSCYKQYLGGASPMPTNTTHLADKFGVYLNPKTAGILSNANAGILSNANAGLISNAKIALIGNDSAGLVNAGGMNLVGNDGAS